jgi:hypothetical protein
MEAIFMKVKNKVTSEVFIVFKVQAGAPMYEWQKARVRFLVYKNGNWVYVDATEYEPIEEAK